MITIVSGTNRKGSVTLQVSTIYLEHIKRSGIDVQLLSLEDLPRDIAFTYLDEWKTPELKELIGKYFTSCDKFVFVVPEYNGTFPGIFKILLDAVPPRDLARKKVLLCGVASGRGGNIRGLDQLTNALHYMGMNIYPKHLPISRLKELSDPGGKITDENILKAIHLQVEEFLRF